MQRKAIVAGIAALTLGVSGAGIAFATGGDDEGGVTGPAADKASAAALRLTGGGTVNAVERDNERGAVWEVEVTKPNGKTVDVRLADDLTLVVIDGDSETADSDTDGSEP